MTLICIEKGENGSHKNRTLPGKTPKNYPIPEGYALIPAELGTPDTLEHYPIGDITVEDRDGIPTVTSWTPLPVPEPEPAPELPQYTELQLLGQQITELELMVLAKLGGEIDV